ncbi:MAG: FkbM family methyltransferase [Bacteroidetes bacterium]|nr:FkbM family methyltransferase [Bacteroidota bacterium]MBS1756124.1 FkbM family methyltransferase [Bacteroidota bacterium]
MAVFKKILFKALGLKNYLKVLHKGFHLSYSLHLLSKDNIYKYHYFDKKFIKEGDVVLDIGANLGYYTLLFSKWVGPNGMVYAVEPVKEFAETIQWAAKKCHNIKLYNYALGEKEQEVILATPNNFGYLRTGLAHVIDNNEEAKNLEFTFKAQMKKGSDLFANIERLDFIKCDIEGYEEIVLPEMHDILIKFKPPIQLETWGEHQPKIETFLLNNGYEKYCLDNAELKPLQEIKNPLPGDYIFIHRENTEILKRLRM